MSHDNELKTSVLCELKWGPGVDAVHIGVSDGEIATAADTAWAAPGATSVENDIRVN